MYKRSPSAVSRIFPLVGPLNSPIIGDCQTGGCARRRASAAPRPARNAQENIAVNETCSPAEQAAIAAFKNGASVNRVAALIGRTPGSVEWLLKKNGLKKNDHRKP